MLVDTHSHIHDTEMFKRAMRERGLTGLKTPKQYLKNARKNGIEKIIVVGTSLRDSVLAGKFASKHKGVYATYGIHPSEVENAFGDMMLAARNQFPVIAIGEIGLDYHYENFDKMKQIFIFEQMLQLARDNNLPAILHIREAFPDAIRALDNFKGVRGVAHSFSDSPKNAEKLLDRGFYIGLNGIATFTDNAQWKKAYKAIPLERIVLETDAPFLAPEPRRTELNQPANVKYVAEWLARERGESLEKIAKITTGNVAKLFKI